MPPQFRYPCPDCRSTRDLHDPDCRFGGRAHHEIERAYVELLAPLAVRPRELPALRSAVPAWSPLHAACLETLRRQHRLEETGDGLELLTPEERTERVSTPDHDPVRTIFEHGSVPGCHDNAVFALIAWYEMVGLSWAETRENTVAWLSESGAWDRGGFEESTPEELVDKKRHVYEAGYGWKEKATAAKRVIDAHRG